MELGPSRNVSHVEFYLMGFSSLKERRQFLFIPFGLVLLFGLVTNSMLVYVIVSQKSLHSPMYLLISAIACIDMLLPLGLVPRMLFSFLSGVNAISRAGCLIQMFFLHYVASFQSTVLLCMAVDRYFAICAPLRYNDIMTLSNSLAVAGAFFIRNTAVFLALVSLLSALKFCSSNVLYHCFCEHQMLVTLACGDTRKNYLAGLIAFCVPSIDCACIAGSYVYIFAVIFRSAGGESRQKAIQTCCTHIMVICIAYTSVMIAFLGYRVKHSIPPDIRVLLSCMYLLVPGCFNPVIYGLRTTEIRKHFLKTFKCGKHDPL